MFPLRILAKKTIFLIKIAFHFLFLFRQCIDQICLKFQFNEPILKCPIIRILHHFHHHRRRIRPLYHLVIVFHWKNVCLMRIKMNNVLHQLCDYICLFVCLFVFSSFGSSFSTTGKNINLIEIWSRNISTFSAMIVFVICKYSFDFTDQRKRKVTIECSYHILLTNFA